MMDVKQVFNKKYLISFEADMSRFPSLPESAFHFVGRQIPGSYYFSRVLFELSGCASTQCFVERHEIIDGSQTQHD